MLQLNQVDFGQLDCVLKKYLKEFSLPKYLAKMLKRSLGNCDQLYDLAFKFEKYQIPKKNYKEENANPVLASDIRAVALILFSLKLILSCFNFRLKISFPSSPICFLFSFIEVLMAVLAFDVTTNLASLHLA